VRVLLVQPPSPEQLGAPLLGLQYVAAALVREGHTIRVLDAAAKKTTLDEDAILAEADRFGPDVVAMGLYTRWVWHAYRLVARLRGRYPLFVAGGPHATVCPEETIERGFDVAIVGEAEQAIVEIVAAFEAQSPLEGVAGCVVRTSEGPRRTATPPWREDLDGLAFPTLALDAFDPAIYEARSAGGLLTSRGCPARCTFCANYVTGRRFRHRSAENVIRELREQHAITAATFYPFWDDALTANVPRMLALCDAFRRDLDFPLAWSAITRANMASRETLRAMKAGGCVSVNFGVESGDDGVLRAIKKGVTTAQVVRALEAAKAEGLLTACNFMLGFPEETPAALESTLRFMEYIAPLVDTFSTLGVLVPFPGTPLYEDHHARYGFTRWWLREDHARYRPPPSLDDREEFRRYYIDDANLELDFFRYDDERRALIRACLRFKAEHNLARMGLFDAPRVA